MISEGDFSGPAGSPQPCFPPRRIGEKEGDTSLATQARAKMAPQVLHPSTSSYYFASFAQPEDIRGFHTCSKMALRAFSPFLVRWERVPPCLTVSVISSASETLGHNVQSGLTILSGRGARYPIEKLWAPLSLRCGCAHNR